jgi:hypothetical protein
LPLDDRLAGIPTGAEDPEAGGPARVRAMLARFH